MQDKALFCTHKSFAQKVVIVITFWCKEVYPQCASLARGNRQYWISMILVIKSVIAFR